METRLKYNRLNASANIFNVNEFFQCVASGMWPLWRSIAAQIDMQLFTPQEVRECAAVNAALHQLTEMAACAGY